MSSAQHLFRRDALYHYRRRFPASLNALLKRSHYSQSLRTADPERARRLARRVSVAIDALAERVARMPLDETPTPGQLNLVLKKIFDDILLEGEKQRGARDGAPSFPSELRDKFMSSQRLTEDDVRRYNLAYERGEFVHGLPEVLAEHWQKLAEDGDVEEIQDRLNTALTAIDIPVPPEAAKGLAADATKVAATAFGVEQKRWKGDYTGDQTPPGWLDRKYMPAPSLIRSWAGNLTAKEVNFLARRVKDVGEEFIQYHLQQMERAAKTERDWRMSLRYFLELIGNARMGDITDAETDLFRKLLNDVPSLIGKGIYARLSAKEAAAKAMRLRARISEARDCKTTEIRFDGRRLPIAEAIRLSARMTMKTANKHLSFFTSMWRSRVVPSSLRQTNPFAGSLYTKREIRAQAATSVARLPFDTAELIRLFGSPVWKGCASMKRRSMEGPYIYPDARFWCPLIALFTGMRREEICQLKGSDFDWHGSIWLVHVQPTEGRRLKTPAAVRDIPIHSQLIKIGLKEFVKHCGSGYLFPELVPSAVDGSRGDPLGKWFLHYRRSRRVKVAREETDFHSFRTSFSQYLRNEGVPFDQIKPLLGHEEDDVMGMHYAKNLSIEQKKKIVERLKFGVPFEDLFSRLYGRMPQLLRSLERRK